MKIIPQCCRSASHISQGTEAHFVPLLPARVLDLGWAPSDGTSAKMRLHISTESEQACYVALSHRWGLKSSKQKMPSRTTLRNICHQCDEIDFQGLPRTFRDAVTVTRKLGFRYLWIDALCIVQDDPNDWRLESTNMGSIFDNANVTIAAHSARNSADGFLWRREVPEYLPAGQWKRRDALRATIYTRIPRLSDSAIAARFRDSEINRRAWCVQELCLSHRILHFVEDDIIWECPHQALDRTGIHTPAARLRSLVHYRVVCKAGFLLWSITRRAI